MKKTELNFEEKIEEVIWEEISVPLCVKDKTEQSDNYVIYLNAVYWAKWGIMFARNQPKPLKVEWRKNKAYCNNKFIGEIEYIEHDGMNYYEWTTPSASGNEKTESEAKQAVEDSFNDFTPK